MKQHIDLQNSVLFLKIEIQMIVTNKNDRKYKITFKNKSYLLVFLSFSLAHTHTCKPYHVGT